MSRGILSSIIIIMAVMAMGLSLTGCTLVESTWDMASTKGTPPPIPGQARQDPVPSTDAQTSGDEAGPCGDGAPCPGGLPARG